MSKDMCIHCWAPGEANENGTYDNGIKCGDCEQFTCQVCMDEQLRNPDRHTDVCRFCDGIAA